MKICPLCNKKKAIINEHHEIPRASGGENGPTIFICSECHDALHICARNILSGKGVQAQDIAKATFVNRKKSHELIKTIITHTLRKKEGKIPDSKLEYKVNLVFPGEIRRCLEILAKDHKTSMVNYLNKLVMNHIKRKFPLAKIGEKKND